MKNSNPRISCQNPIPLTKIERRRFDLQTVDFRVWENATWIIAMEFFKRSFFMITCLNYEKEGIRTIFAPVPFPSIFPSLEQMKYSNLFALTNLI
jgi:hypothetical protein